jgi:type II secretory pathway pseudopilin PulG
MRRQRGISYISVLIAISIFGVLVKVAAVVAPPYYDFYTINQIIESLYRDGRASSEADFRRGLSDRFQINNIRDKSPDDFEYSFDSGKLTVNVDYEVRKPFISNLDVVMHFKKTYSGKVKSEI